VTSDVLEAGTGLVFMLDDRLISCRVNYVNPIINTDRARTEIIAKTIPVRYFELSNFSQLHSKLSTK